MEGKTSTSCMLKSEDLRGLPIFPSCYFALWWCGWGNCFKDRGEERDGKVFFMSVNIERSAEIKKQVLSVFTQKNHTGTRSERDKKSLYFL